MISEEQLEFLERMLKAVDPAPWQSYVEGRDHLAGDDFIMVGEGDERRDDMYVSRSGARMLPADSATLDFIAAARNAMSDLIDEVRTSRKTDV